MDGESRELTNSVGARQHDRGRCDGNPGSVGGPGISDSRAPIRARLAILELARCIAPAAPGSRDAGTAALAWYVAGSALRYSLIYRENGATELLATFLTGVAAALVYLKAGSPWPLIIGHTLVDLLYFW